MTLQNISAAANMSHWHFQRIFKALTNETLKSYVRSRRIVNSLDDLFDQHLSILDIALSSGFESHESYTRAFQKLFGITPSEYRKSAQDRLIFQKHQFDKNYLVNKNDFLLASQQKSLALSLKKITLQINYRNCGIHLCHE